MAGAPPVYVPAPAVTPHRFGLFSVAEFPPSDDLHIESGVQYEPLAYGPAQLTHDKCRSLAADLSTTKGVALVEGTPFTVYAAFDGSLVGRDWPDVERRARAALALGEQRAVEQGYYFGAEGNRPRLAEPSASAGGLVATVLNGGAAVDLVRGVGMLEETLADGYAGEGVIHTPRFVVPHLFDREQLMHEGARLVTHLGTRVAAGAGYGNTSPAGVAAGAGQAWLYATGAVGIWRGEPFLNPTPFETQAFDPGDNSTALIVERTYTVAHEALTAAVLVTL